MREPPAALLRLSRFLGSEPSRDVSLKQQWFSLIRGPAVVVLFAGLMLFPGEREDAALRPFLAPTEIVLGLMSAAWGAAGLLWEDKRSISLWLSVPLRSSPARGSTFLSRCPYRRVTFSQESSTRSGRS